LTHRGHEDLARLLAAKIPAMRKHLPTLLAASTAPDRMVGHRGKVHHSLGANTRRYSRLVRSARRWVLFGMPRNAAWNLGIFLHYLADDAIAVPGTDPDHQRYERRVEAACRQRVPTFPTRVMGRSDTFFANQVAPPVSIFGRYRVPTPADAAGKLLSVAYRVSSAVFAPLHHPDDVAACSALLKIRQEADPALASALVFSPDTTWYCPFVRVVCLALWVIGAALVFLKRGCWFWSPFRFDSADGAYSLYWAWSVFSIWLVAWSFQPGTELRSLAALSYVVGYALFGWLLVWTHRLRGSIMVFWWASAVLVGPVLPFVVAVTAGVLSRHKRRSPREFC